MTVLPKPTARILMISLSVTLTLILFYQPVFADSLDSVKSQIEVLQRQVQELEKQNTAAVEKTEVPPQGNGKGSFRLPGMNTEVTIGGYIKLDLVHSDATAGINSDADRYFYPRAIPLVPTSSKTVLTAKQSRLIVKTRTPTPYGDLKVHIEGDFYGQGGNQKVSNSSTWRLRRAYGQFGNLLVGQTYSTFMIGYALPETLDFGGPAGEIFLRQPQIRWTQPFQWGSLQVGVENPETWLLANDPTISTTPDNDRIPDLIGRLNLKTSVGSFSLAAMGREYRIDSQGVNDSTYASAFSLGGKIKTFGKDDLRFMLNYGDGLGRYMETDFEGAQLDVANNEITAVDQWGALLAYRHYWTDTWRSTFCYSYGEADNHVDIVGNAVNSEFQSVHGNLIWSPIPAVSFGVEYIYGSRELEDGQDGDLNRLQFSARYNFI